VGRLGPLLPALAAVYLWIAWTRVLRLEDHIRLDGALAYLAALCAFLTWALHRRGRLAGGYGIATVGAGLILAQAYVAWLGGAGAQPGAVALLVIMASTATYLSAGWHGALTVGTLGSWFALAGRGMSLFEFLYWSLLVAAAAALGVAGVQFRICRLRRQVPMAPPVRTAEFTTDYLERAVAGTRDGLWYWELDTDVFHYSAGWAELLGYGPEELKREPREWLERVHPGYIARLREELKAHLYGGDTQFRNEHRIRRKDGSYLWVMARATAIRGDDGQPKVLAGSHSDITPVMEAERRMLTDAYSDALTGLPNRAFLMGHLEMAVEERLARGGAAPLFAVLFMDLDRFKFINDTLGHHIGDELLVAVAGRLKNCARPDDVVARFGGDEFVVLLRHLRDAEEAIQVATRMQKSLCAPFQLGGKPVQSGGSVGIALSREEFRTSDDILHYGDVAMYAAKKSRTEKVQVYHRGMADASRKETNLSEELADAIGRDQLVLHYQPQIHLPSGRIVGAEALIRWQRNAEELLYPADFLPLAEKSGLIGDIGDWALRRACEQNFAWQCSGAGPVRMAVNIAAGQLQESDFPRRVEAILAETRLDRQWLELEMAESTLARTLDSAPATLRALRESGIRTTIDDFGAGDASLSHLRHFQFHTMKMDRSFVTNVAEDGRAAAIARGLIQIAHSLELDVVAEGVEKDTQYRFLSDERCDQVQGYFTGRPVPADAMLTLLRQGTTASLRHPAAGHESTLAQLSTIHQPAPAPKNSAAVSWAASRKSRS
jgi:diguanylate cyclase (GGDEF)-like protein/PAS domain S-box-containing protein